MKEEAKDGGRANHDDKCESSEQLDDFEAVIDYYDKHRWFKIESEAHQKFSDEASEFADDWF